MSSKRKFLALGLERRVRARREEYWDPEPDDSEASSSDDDVSEEDVTGDDNDDNDRHGSDSESGSELELDSDEPEPATTGKVDLSSITFSALARAQASLPPPEKKSKTAKPKETTLDPSSSDAPRTKRKSNKDEPKPKRASKHAPLEQSSKRPVSRRREVVPDKRRQYRDPRFDPLVGHVDESKMKKAYAFLDEYRDKEMAELRAQIKKTKNADMKEELKRKLMSMESKKKATKRKEEEQRLLREHRKKEKELVAQGKTPFYLKKSEQKKQLLVNRYAGMSKGQVDRAIERKRKKVAAKEKKELDSLQRVRTR